MKTSEITVSENSFSVPKKAVDKSRFSVPLFAAFLMIVFLVPVNAMAFRDRYVLDFNDSHIRGHRGEPATIFLKKSLKQQYPHANISNMDLRKVVLLAKSKRGKGAASLRVGKRVSSMNQVDGHPRSFNNKRRASFDKVKFHNPSRHSGGPWQVNLNGNFIVRKVVLEVEDHSWSRRHHMTWRRH